MKGLFIILVIGVYGVCSINQSSKFEIDIFDYNYSLAYTLHYHINRDSIAVERIGSLKNEKPVPLFETKLEKKYADKILPIISSDDFRKLKKLYKNDSISDGDRKRFIVQVNGEKKIVDLENSYNKVIAELISAINLPLNRTVKIKYSNR